jgi:hypothetical protein
MNILDKIDAGCKDPVLLYVVRRSDGERISTMGKAGHVVAERLVHIMATFLIDNTMTPHHCCVCEEEVKIPRLPEPLIVLYNSDAETWDDGVIASVCEEHGKLTNEEFLEHAKQMLGLEVILSSVQDS